MAKLYRYTTNGEGVFSAGKRFLPEDLVNEAWEARKWIPKPELPEGEYLFLFTQEGLEKYEQTLKKVHEKYLENLTMEEVDTALLGDPVYQDNWQIVFKKYL
jgi:hypothetical protein